MFIFGHNLHILHMKLYGTIIKHNTFQFSLTNKIKFNFSNRFSKLWIETVSEKIYSVS